MENKILPEAGTYILKIKVNISQNIEIGKLGNFTFKRGYYFYVGSAHGPGGVKARVTRHLKKNKVNRWHIDYLRSAGCVSDILVTYEKRKKECIWASNLNLSPLLSTPVIGFGSSDCNCPSHLFFCKKNNNIKILEEVLQKSVDIIKIK